jgi:hypothetical protein
MRPQINLRTLRKIGGDLGLRSYDLRVADLGIIVTRAVSLMGHLQHDLFQLGRETAGTGSSTTHFGKLEPRIVGGGAGGCPVLVFAMTPELYLDDR